MMVRMITDPPVEVEETDPSWETGIHNAEIDEVVIADLPGEVVVEEEN